LRSSPQSNLRVEPLIQSASWSSTHSISAMLNGHMASLL
jgi:hypothetical protein